MVPTSIVISPEALDTLDEVCLLADFEGNCLYANAAAVALAPRHLQPLPVMPITDVLVAIGATTDAVARISDALQQRSRQQFQVQFGAGDTAHRFEVSLTPAATGIFMLAKEVDAQRKNGAIHEGFGHILEQAEFGVAIGSADGTTLELVNAAYARMHGYSIEELTGKPIATVYPAHCKSQIASNIEANHRAGHRNFETEHVDRNGRVFPVEVDVTSVGDQSGAVQYRIVIVQDITERIAAREELRLREEYFQRLFDHAPIGIAIADLDGRYLAANATMCRMVGYSEEELKRMTYRDITHPDDIAENCRQRVGLLHIGVDSFQMEKRYVHKDGGYLWVLVVVSIIKGPDGKALVSIGQMLNIDQQKRTEALLRENYDAYRAILSTTLDGFWIVDAKGNFVDVNTRYCQQSGYSREELLSMCIADIEAQETAAETADHVQYVFETGRDQFESLHRRKDGSIWNVEVSTICDGSNDGRLYVFLRDITKRKENESDIVRSRQQLRELATHHERMLEEERKNIAREIHDEMGQLLSALRLDVGLLRLSHGGNPDILELAQRMRDSVNKTLDAVRQISSNLRPTALDLGIVAAVEWLAGEFMQRWGIDCEVNSLHGDVVLQDSQSIVAFRVVQESLTNVARHSHARHVSIDLHRRNGEFYLRIKDDGCGFDVDDGGKKGGFGLIGMQERALALGGTLVIDSTAGLGTTVLVTFPVVFP